MVINNTRLKLYQWIRGLLTIILLGGLAASAQAAERNEYAGWHLPLPAGVWRISRGPCGSLAPFSHGCDYYEDQCAVDLIAADGPSEGAPVLAPQAGRVVYLGRRADAGIGVMLEHADGRVSGLLHLERAVVAFGAAVAQGQVVGYLGHTGTTEAHLHFFVQPNLVERRCLPLDGLDELDYRAARATSHNLAGDQITLVRPPADTLRRGSEVMVGAGQWTAAQVALAPGEQIELKARWAGVPGEVRSISNLTTGVLTTLSDPGGSMQLPLQAAAALGENSWLMYGATAGWDGRLFALTYWVTDTQVYAPADETVLPNPDFVGPETYDTVAAAPRLCWRRPPDVGGDVLQYEVRVAGPDAADSGWQADLCWQPPALPAGLYFWKVFVRDAAGMQNRPNQRPFAFVIHRRP